VKREEIIRILQMQPHPEGGYFRETYRSEGVISKEELGEEYSGKRNFSTCIYFLLTSESFSAFHRIVQDEAWHFYDGCSLFLHVISPKGEYNKVIIGRNIEKGEVPQYVVPGGTWFAAEVVNEDSFSLLGCTVAPGFDFMDFEMARRAELIGLFPELREIIVRLSRESIS
jgi:predicted cupin superfamily sugar epimerase